MHINDISLASIRLIKIFEDMYIENLEINRIITV